MPLLDRALSIAFLSIFFASSLALQYRSQRRLGSSGCSKYGCTSLARRYTREADPLGWAGCSRAGG
eukprot:5021601-Pyramimonas_sp.AAC.1